MNLTGTHTIIGYTCPNCGHRSDAVTGIDATQGPRPGDVTMCILCGILERYGDAMVRRPLTLAEFEAFPRDLQATILTGCTARVLALLNDAEPEAES